MRRVKSAKKWYCYQWWNTGSTQRGTCIRGVNDPCKDRAMASVQPGRTGTELDDLFKVVYVELRIISLRSFTALPSF